jgi:NTP pyrophosphatase (non-canonical NTP hydrolase)
MNKTDYLLTCLAEEAGEITQAVGKSLRFGLEDGYPETSRTNRTDLQAELNDLFALVELLQNENVLIEADRAAIDCKKEKVLCWMKYSTECGRLDTEPNPSNKKISENATN